MIFLMSFFSVRDNLDTVAAVFIIRFFEYQLIATKILIHQV